MSKEKQLNIIFWLAITLGIIAVAFRLTVLSNGVMAAGGSYIFFRKQFGVNSLWKKGVVLIVYGIITIVIINVLKFL